MFHATSENGLVDRMFMMSQDLKFQREKLQMCSIFYEEGKHNPKLGSGDKEGQWLTRRVMCLLRVRIHCFIHLLILCKVYRRVEYRTPIISRKAPPK